MPLLDHFRPPLSLRRHWHSFHNAWATSIASQLNERLPEGYFAEPNVRFGIEIDVAAFEGDATGGETPWTPPPPSTRVALPRLVDLVEVRVFQQTGGPVLAGAIELVSPSNKDRPAHREAFTARCRAYLQEGIGLIVVDPVTERGANLHDALLTAFAAEPSPLGADLYAAAYRPVSMEGRSELEAWTEPLAIGRVLPTLPLWLRSGPCVPVDLDASYERTRRELRIERPGADAPSPANGAR